MIQSFKTIRNSSFTKWNKSRKLKRERKVIVYCRSCGCGMITLEYSTSFQCNACEIALDVIFL